jgi:glycosyltransferase involved in cell wall biosynthesis
MIEQALDVPRKQNSESVIIGYASGTATHSADFATATVGIWQSLKDNPNAILKVLGASPISVNKIPKGILSQVVFQPLVPHEELLIEISTFDINIAPLELNPFTEAKSELKFVHAAILGIPTIASPTEPFRKAINHGVNGYLAKSSSEWHGSLNKLVESETLRKAIGFQALLTLRGRYTVPRIAEIFQDAPNLLRASNI